MSDSRTVASPVLSQALEQLTQDVISALRDAIHTGLTAVAEKYEGSLSVSSAVSEPKTTDYCMQCGASPDAAIHSLTSDVDHAYVRPASPTNESLFAAIERRAARQNKDAPLPLPIPPPVLDGLPIDSDEFRRSTAATIVAGELPQRLMGRIVVENGAPYSVKLFRNGPGDVACVFIVAGQILANIPFDNLIKAQVRLDPEHASETQRQVADARKEMAIARAAMYDETARVMQLSETNAKLERQVAELEQRIASFAATTTSTRAATTLSPWELSGIESPRCPGGCSRGGEGPACGRPGCRG